MHADSMELMRDFRERYVSDTDTVLDVGGADVNGSYRGLFGAGYRSLDHAKGVDLVVKGYTWPVLWFGKPFKFDVVISGQALEHDRFFWLTLENMARVLKPSGTMCIIVPSHGHIHRHPVDCYRFFPDAMGAFAELMQIELLECDELIEGEWLDVRGIFRKPAA